MSQWRVAALTLAGGDAEPPVGRQSDVCAGRGAGDWRVVAGAGSLAITEKQVSRRVAGGDSSVLYRADSSGACQSAPVHQSSIPPAA